MYITYDEPYIIKMVLLMQSRDMEFGYDDRSEKVCQEGLVRNNKRRFSPKGLRKKSDGTKEGGRSGEKICVIVFGEIDEKLPLFLDDSGIAAISCFETASDLFAFFGIHADKF